MSDESQDEHKLIARRREVLASLRESGQAFPNDFRRDVVAGELRIEYESRTKDRDVVGPEVLSEVLEAMKDSHIPVVAIGGIDEKNVVELIERGVRCVAVCSAINCAENPKQVTQQFVDLMNEAEEKEK